MIFSRPFLWRASEVLTKAERLLLVFFLTMIIVVVFAGVLIRYTPITGETLWTAELARLFLLWISCWAAGSVEREDSHFKADIVAHLFKGKAHLALNFFISCVVLISIALVVWSAFNLCMSSRNVVTEILQWPAMVRPLPLLCGALLLFSYVLANLIRNLRRLLG